MRLRELIHILRAEEIMVITPENEGWDEYEGKTHGLGSAISRACQKYGDRDVDSILVNDSFSCTICLY